MPGGPWRKRIDGRIVEIRRYERDGSVREENFEEVDFEPDDDDYARAEDAYEKYLDRMQP